MRLSQINIYPIKSLAGIPVQESAIESRGLSFDRRWMLVDDDNRFLTQREIPAMALIKVRMEKGNPVVSLGERSIEIPAPQNGDSATVTIWNSQVKGKFYGGEIDEWFSEALGNSCRLVRMPEETERKVNPLYAVRKAEDVVSFADGYPFMLIGQGSLADLNSKLDTPLPMNRFRPNFVVEGSEAFAEDNWKLVRIGETVFHIVKPCERCVITTIDQNVGEKGAKEPLKTLSTYRNRNGNVLFGQNLIAEDPGGTVRVGDEIEVLELRDPAA